MMHLQSLKHCLPINNMKSGPYLLKIIFGGRILKGMFFFEKIFSLKGNSIKKVSLLALMFTYQNQFKCMLYYKL